MVCAKQITDVSTRAPAKGATLLPDFFFPFFIVSTRAPAKGATDIFITE